MIFIKYKIIFLSIAAAVIATSIGILLTLGLPLGIDFTGGALTEVSYTERPAKEQVEAVVAPLELGGTSLRETIAESGRPGYVLRTRDLSESERIAVEEALLGFSDDATLERFTSVGPVIGEELKQKSYYAIGGVIVIIIFYVAYAFSGIGQVGRSNVSSWQYGFITIVALLHDVLVPTAVFAVLGYVAGAEADVLFVMALLAVLGYSVNDTIVVFDRVRENLQQNQKDAEQLLETHGKTKENLAAADALLNEPFAQTVGRAVNQTIARSINTSITTMLALTALYMFGGEVTQNFSLVLLAGVIAGTYSSIALANPLLVFISERLPERSDDEPTKKKREPKPGEPGYGQSTTDMKKPLQNPYLDNAGIG